MNAQTDSVSQETQLTPLRALPTHGVWAPPVTPFTSELLTDQARWISHLHWLLENGCHGLALFGTTSEANSFSVEERINLLESVLEAGIDPERLMVGTGCCALADSVRLTRHAAESGCKKVLMLPPFYYKGVSDEGLYRNYAHIIDAVADPALKVILYHFPKMSAIPITMDLIERLTASYPEVIAGVKDSSGDWQNTATTLERFPNLAIFPGSETFLLDGLEAGGAGCISATANVNPTAIRAVFDGWCEQDDDVSGQQTFVNNSRSVFNKHPAIPAIKHVIAHYQADPDWRTARPPLVNLNDAVGTELIAELGEQEFAFPGTQN